MPDPVIAYASNHASDMGVVVERLDGLRKDMGEIKGLVSKLMDAQTDNAVEHEKLENKAGTAIKATEDHEKRIAALEKAIQPLIVANRILVYLAGALVLSILALIWALIIGQAQVVFP